MENKSILTKNGKGNKVIKFPDEENEMNELIEDSKFQKRGGAVADYIPELRLGLSSKVGLSIFQIGEDKCHGFGDHKESKRQEKSEFIKQGHIDENDRAGDDMFTIQSISKVLALLYVLEKKGEKYVFKRVGKEPTGDPFNAPPRIKKKGDVQLPYNPLINVGAILITSMFPGKDRKVQFDDFFEFVKDLCDAPNMMIDEAVFESERDTGHNNRSLAWKMDADGIFRHDPDKLKNNTHKLGKAEERLDRTAERIQNRKDEVVRVEEYLENYFRQCSILVNTDYLSRVAYILANGGIGPNGKKYASRENVHTVVSLMSNCGVYDGSGAFAQEIGIPAKSGVGGGIMAVVPGIMGIATYCPALDEQGNSIRGMFMLEHLSKKYNLSVFYKGPNDTNKSIKIVDTNWLQKAVDDVSNKRIPNECQPFEYIPSLTSAKANCLEIAVMELSKDSLFCQRTTDEVIQGGEDKKATKFSLQSISNILALLYVLQNKSEGRVFNFVGKEPSGESFKDVKWIDAKTDGNPHDIPFNPMINAGAIVLAAMIPSQYGNEAKRYEDFSTYYKEKSNRQEDIKKSPKVSNDKSDENKIPEVSGGYLDIKDFLKFVRRLLGNNEINVQRNVFDSERSTGYSNRAIAWEINDKHVFDRILASHYFKDNKKIDNNDIEDILGVYFQLCSIEVTVKDLAHLAAILANGGKDINSDTYLLSPREVAIATSLISTSGLYDESGEFSCATGIPTKSGASGGLMGVVPGKMGIAIYSPTVTPAGNSFFGKILLEKISAQYNLSIFSSKSIT